MSQPEATPAARRDRPRIAIRHARVIDGLGRAALADQLIIVSGTRIAAVVPDPGGEVDAEAVINAPGLTAIPGLIDAHAHLISGGFDTIVDSSASYELADQHRVLRQMLYWGVVGCHFSVQPLENGLSLRAASWSGSMESPRLFVSGPGLTAPGGWAGSNEQSARRELASPDDARAVVGELAAAGVDFIKVFYDDMCCAFSSPLPKLDEAVLQEVVTEAHRLGLPVAVHVYELEGHREAISAGADILYHSAVTGEVDEAYLDEARTRRITYVATLSIFNDTYNPEAVRTWAAAPEVQHSVPAETLLTLARGGKLDDFSHFTRGQEIARQLPVLMDNVRRVHEAGIRVLAGPDTGVPGVFPGLSVHREMELMVAAGLPPLAAIAAATSQAASCLGEPRMGAIEKGRFADFLLVSGDPASDIRATRNINTIVKDGTCVNRSDLLSAIMNGASRQREPPAAD